MSTSHRRYLMTPQPALWPEWTKPAVISGIVALTIVLLVYNVFIPIFEEMTPLLMRMN